MRSLFILLFILGQVWGQTEPLHKCGFQYGAVPYQLNRYTGDRDIPQFDESVLDRSMVSPSGRFRIHFTLTGAHAVTNPEALDLPTFVTETAISADSVYKKIVDELGFLAPTNDGDIDGPEMDIYIRNWGGEYYGMTYFDPYVSLDPYPGFASYLVLDNDYVESSYATRGLEALRVTIAHEFFHMVQLSYAHPGEFSWQNLNWYELSSVWMEEVCYPEIDDYHAYVEDNFRQINFPDLDGPSSYSYGHGIFAQMLDLEYGVRNDKHIMLAIWERLHGHLATENLKSTLESSPWNSSLGDALGKYALYNVFTGSRAIPGQYYPDASELPEIRTMAHTLPLDVTDTLHFSLQPYQIRYKRVNLSTLSDFHIKCSGQSAQDRVYLSRHGQSVGNEMVGVIGNYWIPSGALTSQDYLIIPISNGSLDFASDLVLYFEGGTIPLDNMIQALWPNPVSGDHGELTVNLLLSEAGPLVIKWYNLRGQEIERLYTENPYEGVLELSVPLPQNHPSGIYFLQLRAGANYMQRKVTIIR